MENIILLIIFLCFEGRQIGLRRCALLLWQGLDYQIAKVKLEDWNLTLDAAKSRMCFSARWFLLAAQISSPFKIVLVVCDNDFKHFRISSTVGVLNCHCVLCCYFIMHRPTVGGGYIMFLGCPSGRPAGHCPRDVMAQGFQRNLA